MNTHLPRPRYGRIRGPCRRIGASELALDGQQANEAGNEARSATYLWVTGTGYVNWRQENNDRIDLVADQRSYQVGDTSTVLIPHPYQGPVKALITIERGHIYQHWVQTLETNSEQIEIPITEDLIPNIFVSVVIVQGEEGSIEMAAGRRTHIYAVDAANDVILDPVADRHR